MSNKKINFLQIGIALLFAAAIILSNFLMKGSEHSNTVMFILIALWFIPYLYLSRLAKKKELKKLLKVDHNDKLYQFKILVSSCPCGKSFLKHVIATKALRHKELVERHDRTVTQETKPLTI